MDVRKLPTTDAMAPWYAIVPGAVSAAEKLAADAYDLRQVLSGIWTRRPLGVWLAPDGSKVAIDNDFNAPEADQLLVKRALAPHAALDEQAVPDPATGWVKVAYSNNVLRTGGELLNFFPRYNDQNRVANAPGVWQSMLTSGLVGAGLGYGGGWLAEKLFPEKWRKGRLRRTMAVIGGLAGATPSLMWGLGNVSAGRDFFDKRTLHTPRADAQPGWYEGPTGWAEKYPQAAPAADSPYKMSCDRLLERLKAAYALGVPGDDEDRGETGARGGAVDVDEMGRLLWTSGASPQSAGMIMGALGAAQQMPGGRGPGWVTPRQMAGLAANMGGGYLSGMIVGKALGVLTGMPQETQERLAQTGMYVALARAALPSLWGG